MKFQSIVTYRGYFLLSSAWFHNGGARHSGCVVERYLLKVGESLPAPNVAAPPVAQEIPQPPPEDLDDLENVLRAAFDEDDEGVGLSPPPTPESLPSLDDFAQGDLSDPDEDEVPVFADLVPVSLSPPRSWARNDSGGLRQSPPRAKIFDL